MSVLNIEGGRRLSGEICVHGAKNGALPILAATIAAQGTCEIHNCPHLSDVEAAGAILRWLGCRTSFSDGVFTVDSTGVSRCDIPEQLMREMRSSIAFLGALLTRTHKAQLSMPGGCELGPRPIDLHLDALRRMGAEVEERGGYIVCSVDGRLKGCRVPLSFPSVGATENIMTAAATAKGTTVITNAAREPEISDLAAFLNACGARISGAGGSTVVIEGVEKLGGCAHSVIPDRIEAATYMSAAAITGGNVLIKCVCPEHLMPVIPAFEEMGCDIAIFENSIKLDAPKRPGALRYIRTMPYPGFPTDAQAILMACTCRSAGSSIFAETIFDNRFRHTGELCRLGAKIKTDGHIAVVEGVEQLYGAPVSSTDLRGGAALVVAGLAAKGTTTVSELRHIDRGYQDIELALASLGADIKRTDG